MDYREMICFGVAGNFAGHMQQARETGFNQSDLLDVRPKGIFPFYVPAPQSRYLGVYPLNTEIICLPGEGYSIQLEPEVGLICRMLYKGLNVYRVVPERFGAFNDTSDRGTFVTRFSQKKNWGENTKGMSEKLIEIDKFESGGILDSYRIACWVKRNGEYHEYGLDSPVIEYMYFHQQLLDYIVEQMNMQRDESLMESIAVHIARAGYPEYAMIGIGATKYTEFGRTKFLERGDISNIAIYDGNRYSPADIESRIRADSLKDEEGLVALVQQVVQA